MEYVTVIVLASGFVRWINDMPVVEHTTLTDLGRVGFRVCAVLLPETEDAPMLLLERELYSETAQHNPIEQFYFTPRKEEAQP